ncbi:VanZ like family protein [Colletotrichum paranaense]|uniref:VanZ like family protein n=1 Tax=Colletotrichum paranaense TaxID=1914294 RepID=A0ABQ9SR73_9PEZI|nr:VanZ like family protein [Colletotrichum paranaense]KAK1541506.1 VanZ like family protein [Colletotrichum paranaense]
MSIRSLYTSSRAPHNSHHPPPVTSSASTGAHRVWHPQTSISRQYLTAAHGIFRPGHLNPTKPGPLHLLQNPRGPTPVLEERSRTLRSKAWGWGAPPLLHISFRQWAELHFAFPHQDQKKSSPSLTPIQSLGSSGQLDTSPSSVTTPLRTTLASFPFIFEKQTHNTNLDISLVYQLVAEPTIASYQSHHHLQQLLQVSSKCGYVCPLQVRQESRPRSTMVLDLHRFLAEPSGQFSSISQLQLLPKPQPKLKLNFISFRAQTSAQARKCKYAEPKLTLPSSSSGVFFALLLVAGYAGLTTLQLGQYVNDKVLHFTTFFLLTIVFYWILDTNRRRTLNLTLTVCTFILGVGSEFLQGFLPNGREFDFYDIVANVVGSLAGIGLCSWYHKRMLERKRRTKTYQAVPGEDEEDVELGEGHETGVVEASGARDGGAGVGAGASSGGRSLEEEVDNWDENQVDDWEEEDGDGDIGGVKSKDMDTGDIGDSKKRAD